jgi:hypothetical protein
VDLLALFSSLQHTQYSLHSWPVKQTAEVVNVRILWRRSKISKMFQLTFMKMRGISDVIKRTSLGNSKLGRPATNSFGLTESIQPCEIADLLSSESSNDPGNKVDSRWGSGRFSRESVLFPSELIERSRSTSIDLKNVDRLELLWSLSMSHGVSWDELDEAFLSFHRDYLKTEHEWAEGFESKFTEEYTKSEVLLRKTVTGDEAQVALTMNRRRGKIRRMTYTRLARIRNNRVIKPFSLPAFKEYMKRFVEVRVAKREVAERSL